MYFSQNLKLLMEACDHMTPSQKKILILGHF